MKRNLFYVLIAFLATCTFFACSGDDDNFSDGSQLVGKWQLVSVSPANMAEDYDDCEFKGYIEFTADGKYSDHRPCGVSDIGGGKWKLSGNTLTITSDILPVPLETTIELADDVLIIIQDAYDFDEDYNVVPVELKETYKRVN